MSAPGRRYRVSVGGIDSASHAGGDGILQLDFPEAEGAGPAREVVVTAL